MNESGGVAPDRVKRPSLLLPAGASILVIALVIEFLGRGELVAVTMGGAGALAALGAWIMALVAPQRFDPIRGTRFLAITAIALSVSPILGPEESWVGILGVMGLWLAVGGAGIEWRRGRIYTS